MTLPRTREQTRRRAAGLLVGMLLGFLSCVAAGWATRDTNVHARFVRFHTYINFLTLYYPTASEVRAVVRAHCSPDRVLVVLGGNSVFYGVGQPPDAIWSAHLQEELGDGYCVVNLAVPRSLIGDFGAVTVGMLAREYPRALLVEALLPGRCGPPDGDPIHRYLFWDAYRKGLLPYPHAPTVPMVHALDTEDPELALRTRLDAALSFNDLWNRVEYDVLSTVWVPLLAPAFPEPRRVWPDDAATRVLPADVRFVEGRQPVRRDLTLYSEPFFVADGRGGWEERPGPWQALEDEIAALPPLLRGRTLIVLNELNTFYVSRLLDASERLRYRMMYEATARRWVAAGFDAMSAGGDFPIEDFADMLHLVPAGGERLAHELAPRVRALARPFGGVSP